MFKCLGAEPDEMAVPTGSVVDHLDVFEDIWFGHVTCSVGALFDALLLQAAKEKLCHGIVPAITPSTYARFQVIGIVKAPPVITAVL